MTHNKPTPVEQTEAVKSGLRDRNTIAQVAAFWGVSPDTVRRLADSGRLDALRIGGVIRITREQVLAYEAANSTALQARQDKERADRMRANLNDPFERGKRVALQERLRAEKGTSK